MIFEKNSLIFSTLFSLLILFFLLSRSENTTDFQDLVDLGRIQMKRCEFGKAIKSFKKAIEKNPNDTSTYCSLGKSYIWYLKWNPEIAFKKDKKQKYAILKKAKNAYRKSLERDPNSICAYAGLGEYYSYINDYERSLFHYQKVTELNPHDRKIYRAIGNVYIDLDKLDLAREAFKTFLEGAESSIDYNKDYHFISRDKIRILSREFFLESNVRWRVVDPIIYEGAIGYLKGAEARMDDIYYASLRYVIAIYPAKNDSDILSSELQQQIIRDVNEYSLKRCGIEVCDVSIKIIK